MAYLILNDYYAQIQIQNLVQIIGNDFTKLTSAANKAEEQCKSYLVQKYDVAVEFTDTAVWSFTKTYQAYNRVYLDAPAYSASATYLLNALTLQNGNVYICSVAITVAEVFTPAHWTLIGAQNTIYYAGYPKPVFNNKLLYNVGDQVWWANKTYTALIKTVVPGHDTQLQYGKIENAPLLNVFPDDPNAGAQYWGVGVAYTVPAGTLPTNATYWTEGDNRSFQLLETLIDIALYKIHKRIAPRNIPDLRVKAYDDAIDWLKDAKDGEVTANIPIIQPSQGMRIRYGGNVKNINSY